MLCKTFFFAPQSSYCTLFKLVFVNLNCLNTCSCLCQLRHIRYSVVLCSGLVGHLRCARLRRKVKKQNKKQCTQCSNMMKIWFSPLQCLNLVKHLPIKHRHCELLPTFSLIKTQLRLQSHQMVILKTLLPLTSRCHLS